MMLKRINAEAPIRFPMPVREQASRESLSIDGNGERPMQRQIIISLFMLLTIFAVPRAHSEGRIVLVGGNAGTPTCGDFYDKWEVDGAPAGILAMAGFGREVVAAQDCVKQNNVAMACEHWRKLLPVIDRTGPPLDAMRGDIEGLMQEHSCG